jgi:hypothetical protein
MDVGSARRRALYLHNKHETDIHAPGGIWTRNPSKRVAADLRLRLGAHLRFIAAATEKSQSPKSIAVRTRRPKIASIFQ